MPACSSALQSFIPVSWRPPNKPLAASSAFLDHERAKNELKALMPEDVREAIGHGVRGKRSKSGAVSFDLLATEATHAEVQ
jgi:hypothetical protein